MVTRTKRSVEKKNVYTVCILWIFNFKPVLLTLLRLYIYKVCWAAACCCLNNLAEASLAPSANAANFA